MARWSQSRWGYDGSCPALLAAARPSIKRIWCFGSVLASGFREHSDLDLLIEALPPEGWLEAVALAERSGPLSVDLKHAEDLPPDLLTRLLRQSQEL